MSAKEYIAAYEHMTEKQKDIMEKLWWSAVNHDCHAWVKETEVRIALNDLFWNMRTEELPIVNELFKETKEYEGSRCVTYGALEKAVGQIVLGRCENGRKPDTHV